MTNPDVMCTTLVFRIIFPSKSKYKPNEIRYITLENIPVLAVGSEIPEKEKQKLYRKIFDEHIHKGDFSKYKISIVEVKKIEFLSKICYQYTF